MIRRASGFFQDDRGAVGPLIAIGAVGLAMAGALAWDVSRGFAMRAELDGAVDAAALAGATQLDGTTGAKTRATTAAQSGLVRNGVYLGRTPDTDATEASEVTICFKETLSGACTTTLADDKANFIQVDAKPKSMGLVLGALGSIKTFQVIAHAVAGYGSALCKVPPVMLCNPNEDTDPTFSSVIPGVGVSMLAKPDKNDVWHPGNFGFLKVDGSGSASVLSDAVARVSPKADCFGKTVSTAPGDKDTVKQAFNVRFDLYTSSMKNKEQKDVNYQPALNTMVGKILPSNSGDMCDASKVSDPSTTCPNPSTDATGMGLPPDCNQQSQHFGDGKWDYAKYFDINHKNFDISTVTWSNYGPNGPQSYPTRYQVYNWEKELLASATPVANTFTNGRNGTTGTSDFAKPMCYSGPTATQQTPDRRTISVVLVNCTAEGVSGNTTGVHVIGGVDIFLLAPVVDRGSDSELYGEVIQRTTDLSAVGKETRLYSVRLYE